LAKTKRQFSGGVKLRMFPHHSAWSSSGPYQGVGKHEISQNPPVYKHSMTQDAVVSRRYAVLPYFPDAVKMLRLLKPESILDDNGIVKTTAEKENIVLIMVQVND